MILVENLITANSPREILHSRFKSIDEMPIHGGWGYTKNEAVIIDKHDKIVPQYLPFDGVNLEHIFIQYRTYLELITIRAEDDRFSGINFKLSKQELFEDDDGKIYDKLTMHITAHRDQDFEELKEEWESGLSNKGFDYEAHEKKREEKLIHIERECWFEISSFYGQDLIFPSDVEKKKTLIKALVIELTDEEKISYLKDDKIIKQFFTDENIHDEFKSSYDTKVVSENSKWVATLTKEDSTKWIYKLKLGEGNMFMGEYLKAFELTEENIKIFNLGVEIISLQFEEYLISGEFDEDTKTFGKLTY